MARVNSPLPRFKRIERRMRETANRCRDALLEIDIALGGQRTAADRALLEALRADMLDVHQRSKAALGKLFEQIQERRTSAQKIARQGPGLFP